MAVWKPASTVFAGGTQQVTALVGARVRNKAHLSSVRLFDPVNNTQRTIELIPGTIGFVANPQGGDLLIAFSAVSGATYPSLAALKKANAFHVAIVNEATFKFQFEVER